MTTIAAAITDTAQKIMTAIQATATPDKEVSELTENVGSLSRSVLHWNIGYLILLAVTVLVAASTLIVTVVIVSKNWRLSQGQKALSEAKDRQLQRDLKDKDESIAKLNNETEQLKASNLALERLINEPRDLTPEFRQILQNGPKGGDIIIQYVPGNKEAWEFAKKLLFEIQTFSAEKWRARIEPWNPETPSAGEIDIFNPPVAIIGVMLVVPGWSTYNPIPEPYKTLYDALLASKEKIGEVAVSDQPSRPSSSPALIIVGSKF